MRCSRAFGRLGVVLAGIVIILSAASARGEAQRVDPTALFNLSRDFTTLVSLRTAAVVRVAGRFTGVVMDGRGYVLTDIRAVPSKYDDQTRIPVDFASGRQFAARPVYRAVKSRTAMLKILKSGRLKHIPAGDSDALRVGDLAMTIGNAFNQASAGGQPALTVGHVAGLWASGKSAESSGARVSRIVVTAAINPGTTGGPLIDVRGALIGINDPRRGAGDMGQVVPINLIRASYRENPEAHRILSFRGSKRSVRRYAGFLQTAVADCVRRASPAVVSLVIKRKPKPKKKAPQKATKKNEKKGESGPSKGGAKKGDADKTKGKDKNEGNDKDKDKDKKEKQEKPKPTAPPRAQRRDGMIALRPRPKGKPGRPSRRPTPPRFKRRTGPVSAVVIAPEGWALTATGNLHGDIETIEAVLHDGRRVKAERFGTDRLRGVTLLKLDATALPVLEPVPPQPAPSVGRFVIALGNPYGGDGYGGQGFMTFGVLSARGQLDGAKSAYQTDAWVNQANQGGALVDLEGRLLGVTFLHRPERFGLNSGIGFAVPLWALRGALPRLQAKKDVDPGYLGVRLVPYEEAGASGARIGRVVELSPAAASGLQAGDRILEIDGGLIGTAYEALRVLSAVEAGSQVAVRVRRGAESVRVSVTAAKRG